MTSCDLALENLEFFLTFTLPLKSWHFTQGYWVGFNMRCMRTIVLLILVISIGSTTYSQDESDCPTVRVTTETLDNVVLLSNGEIITSNGEVIISSEDLPDNFRPYFDLSTHQILLWSTSHPQDETSNDVSPSVYQIDVWSLEENNFVVNDFQLPKSYRPIQWLDDNQFLFVDWATNSLVIFSIERGELVRLLETQEVPSMRLIPVSFRVDYDIKLSPNQLYLAYENEDINRGIAVWDSQELGEIEQFLNEDSLPLESHPSWSHNSQYLAVANFVETEMQLFLYDVTLDEQRQITDFDTYPSDIEMGRPFSTIHTILWSLDDNYIATSGTFSDVQVINVESSTALDSCIFGTPILWLQDYSLLISSEMGLLAFDIEDHTLTQVRLENGNPIGWLP